MTAAAGQARRNASIHWPTKASLQPKLIKVTQHDIKNDRPNDMKKVAISLRFMAISPGVRFKRLSDFG